MRREASPTKTVSLLRELASPLMLAMKCASLARIAKTLVETYLGRDAGRLVLNGRIARGVTDRIQAVLWFSDLHGFTHITETADPEQIIPFLNDYAEAIISSIYEAGGDVLKLIGDGTLAIFRCEDAAESCRAALKAEQLMRSRVRALNEERLSCNLPVTSAYLGLHIGEVFYGNIGSQDRLDFTVVGSCGERGQPDRRFMPLRRARRSGVVGLPCDSLAAATGSAWSPSVVTRCEASPGRRSCSRSIRQPSKRKRMRRLLRATPNPIAETLSDSARRLPCTRRVHAVFVLRSTGVMVTLRISPFLRMHEFDEPPDPLAVQEAHEIVDAADRLAVEREDDIALLEPGLLRRASRLHGRDRHRRNCPPGPPRR